MPLEDCYQPIGPHGQREQLCRLQLLPQPEEK